MSADYVGIEELGLTVEQLEAAGIPVRIGLDGRPVAWTLDLDPLADLPDGPEDAT